jgi:hypothetical protein
MSVCARGRGTSRGSCDHQKDEACGGGVWDASIGPLGRIQAVHDDIEMLVDRERAVAGEFV